MVRLIEFSLETQFAAEDSHFQPPAFVHRGDMVLSPVTNKKNVRNAKMARRNPSPLATTNSGLSSLRAKAQCSIFGPTKFNVRIEFFFWRLFFDTRYGNPNTCILS